MVVMMEQLISPALKIQRAKCLSRISTHRVTEYVQYCVHAIEIPLYRLKTQHLRCNTMPFKCVMCYVSHP